MQEKLLHNKLSLGADGEGKGGTMQSRSRGRRTTKASPNENPFDVWEGKGGENAFPPDAQKWVFFFLLHLSTAH